MLASRSVATVQEKFALLNCRRLPARLNTSETAVLLGFQEHDIAPLIAPRMLTPLGKPVANSPKYFRSRGNCGAGIEHGVAFQRDESTRETLASKK